MAWTIWDAPSDRDYEEQGMVDDGFDEEEELGGMEPGEDGEPECCRHCGKPLEDFSDLGCEYCDRRHPAFGTTT